ncbi:MAG: protein kinase [Muribaculaceae bacterium]|nr:protein kinase [Roseburia sp.]MCM1431998.1 protein kinase [Muribaculaceae bacterium]MCM1493748.1 protein kinase [Muribaculaceae bacterium]
MNQELLDEFQNQYLTTYAPALPDFLNSYRFISCLQDQPERKIWILEHADGRRILCKYATGEYISMLRNERQIDAYERTYGRFSCFPYMIGYFEADNSAYLLREYIEGETLQDKVEKDGSLTREQAIPIIQQLCRQLALLHQAQPPLIFRDLKPSNVVLTKTGECYLIDMGAVRFFSPERGQDTVLIGTADTAAPEQYGARQTDARTDIYALGRLYAYLLTGTIDAEKSLNALTGRNAAVVKKATAFDPDRRYRNVDEFIDALTSPGIFSRKNKWMAASAALAMALVCALCLLLAPSLSIQTRTVEFSSYLLQQAVTAALGKPGTEPVSYGELRQITSLLICGNNVFDDYGSHDIDPYAHRLHNTITDTYGNIQDISLLQYMTSLNELVLDNQQITDLSPLEGLPVSRLSLSGNPITDLSPLAGCNMLRELHIADTGVSDLTPLSSCTLLADLSISRTKVTNLAPLKGTSLTKLTIGDLMLESYEPLQELPIENLICRGLPKEHFASIADIDSLNHIVLYESGITSLSEVAMFRDIPHLDLCSNQITDLHGIEAFPNLNALVLGSNPLRDISGIGAARQLTSVHVFNTAVTDFSPLTELPQLTELSVSESQVKNLYAAIPEPWFTISLIT